MENEIVEIDGEKYHKIPDSTLEKDSYPCRSCAFNNVNCGDFFSDMSIMPSCAKGKFFYKLVTETPE